MSIHTAKKIVAEAKKANHILLIPHQNPDGDALGAVSAFAQFLDIIKKEYTIFCKTDFSKTWKFLPTIEKLTTHPSVWEKEQFDLIIVFDSGDLTYAGVDEYIQKVKKKRTIINIDHHSTNQRYGDIHMVRTEVSSTSEIVYHILRANDIPITRGIATSLLTGIIYDTDNFTNSATTPSAIAVASSLTNAGADFNVIKNHMYKQIPLRAFDVWGRLFSRLTQHDKLPIVYTYITQKDMNDYGLTDSDVSGMSNFLNAIHDGDAGLILKETPEGKVKGSFRTTRDDVNVAKMAQRFGGGGHKKAAGFSVDGPVKKALERILKELEEMFPEGNIRQN